MRASEPETGQASLRGRVAVLTGAGGGVGLPTALVLAREGATLVLVGRSKAGLDRVREALAGAGHDPGTHAFEHADVASGEQIAAVYERARERFGGVDVLINNAAVEGRVGSLESEPEENLDALLDVNVKGVWRNCALAVRLMRARGGGSIVNCGSGLSLVGSAGLASYSASKHAVLGLTRSLAHEVARYSIRVNAVCPGPTETRMLESLREQRAALGSKSSPSSAADPAEVAEVIAFVASGRAPFMTGAAISVDGGLTAAGAPAPLAG